MRLCEGCNAPILGTSTRVRFCQAIECRRALKREQMRRVYASVADGRREPPGTIDLTCEHCGGAYRSRPRNRFCGRACKAAGMYGPDRIGGRPSSPRVPKTKLQRLALFMRDGWICHICGDLVDRGAQWPDPASPVLDHVDPLFSGGSNDDDNLKTAHAYCNAVKAWKPLEAVA